MTEVRLGGPRPGDRSGQSCLRQTRRPRERKKADGEEAGQGRNEEAVDQKLNPLSRKRHACSENHNNAEKRKETEFQKKPPRT
jgi:hypothetical protein